jgi:coenzyme Q-binding protein COQ10
MSVHSESRLIHAPRERLFELIADVEKYPDFLPMWIDARIYRRREDTYYTEQEIGLGLIRQRFRTKTVLAFPTRIEVTSTDGLFRKFFIGWDLADDGPDCRVTVTLSWEVQSFLLQTAIDLMMPETTRSMVFAFERRARQVLA